MRGRTIAQELSPRFYATEEGTEVDLAAVVSINRSDIEHWIALYLSDGAVVSLKVASRDEEEEIRKAWRRAREAWA